MLWAKRMPGNWRERVEVGCSYDFNRMGEFETPWNWHLRKVLEGV